MTHAVFTSLESFDVLNKKTAIKLLTNVPIMFIESEKAKIIIHYRCTTLRHMLLLFCRARSALLMLCTEFINN